MNQNRVPPIRITSDVASTAPAWARVYDARTFRAWSLTVDVVAFAVDADGDLKVLVVERGERGVFHGQDALPGGFVNWEKDHDGLAAAHRELEEETGQLAEVIEELRTYDEFGRDPRQFSGRVDPESGDWITTGPRIVTRAFVAPLQIESTPTPARGSDARQARWEGVYRYLPWEDQRTSEGRRMVASIAAHLLSRIPDGRDPEVDRSVIQRHFAVETADLPLRWDPEETSARWSLLQEAGLLTEAHRDLWGELQADPGLVFGEPLAFDHRRILADALGWLRAQLRRRPGLARGLVGDEFRLAQLQAVYESVGGGKLTRPNFRRVMTNHPHAIIIEPIAGPTVGEGRGRPASLYGFRPEALDPRFQLEFRLPWTKHLDIE
jgi:hypothetical protein